MLTKKQIELAKLLLKRGESEDELNGDILAEYWEYLLAPALEEVVRQDALDNLLNGVSK